MSLDPIQVINQIIFNNFDLTASQTSSVIPITNAIGYAAHFVWENGNSASGTIIIEGSNDNPDVISSPVFTTIDSHTVSSDDGSFMSNQERAMYSYVRLIWNAAGGTDGTIRATISTKTL